MKYFDNFIEDYQYCYLKMAIFAFELDIIIELFGLLCLFDLDKFAHKIQQLTIRVQVNQTDS